MPESSTIVYQLSNHGIFVLCLYRQKTRIILSHKKSNIFITLYVKLEIQVQMSDMLITAASGECVNSLTSETEPLELRKDNFS